MSSSVLSRLSARLHTSPEETEQLLFALVDQIRRQVKEEGSAIVPGLGVFRQFNGNLVFEPAETLSIAVNYRFAGLEPVLLNPSSHPQFYRKREVLVEVPDSDKPQLETPAPLEPSLPDDPDGADRESAQDSWSSGLEPEETVSEIDNEQESPAPATPQPTFQDLLDEHLNRPEAGTEDQSVVDDYDESVEPVDSSVTEEDVESPVSVLPGQPLFKEWTEETFESEAVVEEADHTGNADEPASVRPTETEPVASLPPERVVPPPPVRTPIRESKPAASRPRRVSIPLIVGVVFLAAFVGVLAYMFLSNTPAPYEEPQPSITEAIPEEPLTTDSVAASVPTEVEPMTPGETTEPEPVTTSVWDSPLRSSDGIDGSAGGYTIVVASGVSREAAQPALERYRRQGFRTSILNGAYREVSRYRIGVGQFQTEADANAALRENDDALPDDAWVMPILSGFEVLN